MTRSKERKIKEQAQRIAELEGCLKGLYRVFTCGFVTEPAAIQSALEEMNRIMKQKLTTD